jgi:uncharacterized protein
VYSHLSNIKQASLFFGLVMSLSLGLVLIFRFFLPQGEVVILLNMLTPLLATLIMMFVVTREGYGGDRRFSLGLAPLARQTWVLAFLLPLPILAVTYSLGWASSVAALAVPTESGWLPNLTINLLINFLVGAVLVASEEIGFRGYLLPRLQGLGDTRAILLSGILHGAWHLPLILLTSFYLGEGNRFLTIPVFLLLLTAAGWVYGKLRLATGSIWPGVIVHASFNVFLGLFTTLTVMRSPLAIYLVGESGVLTLVVTAVAAFWVMQRWPAPGKIRTGDGWGGLADDNEPVRPAQLPFR